MSETKKRCKIYDITVKESDCKCCEYYKRCEAARKSAETKDRKNAADPNKIKHFGVWLDKNNPNLKINRENYTVINKKNSFWNKRTAQYFIEKYKKGDEKTKARYGDCECKFYSNDWCNWQKERCLINFDKNMDFFKKIDSDYFNNMIENLLEYSEHIFEVFDINQCDDVSGIYIMVLGEYKQVYVGQAKNIKSRIKQHWYAKKEFDRLIFGGVNDSVLSIDSFGPLDTTRIFILPSNNLNAIEKHLVDSIPNIYKLNCIGGGGICDLLSVLETWNKRDFENSEFAQTVNEIKMTKKEKYQESVEYIKFSKTNEISLEDLQVGDVVCVKATYYKDQFVEYYGKVSNITKNYISILQYGNPGESEWLKSKINKIENNCRTTKRQTKKGIKCLWETTSEIKVKKRTRYRIVKSDDVMQI